MSTRKERSSDSAWQRSLSEVQLVPLQTLLEYKDTEIWVGVGVCNWRVLAFAPVLSSVVFTRRYESGILDTSTTSSLLELTTHFKLGKVFKDSELSLSYFNFDAEHSAIYAYLLYPAFLWSIFKQWWYCDTAVLSGDVDGNSKNKLASWRVNMPQ